MKILMITGASRAVVWFRQELIKYLQNRGDKVCIVTCDDDNKEIIKKLDVEYYCINGNNRDTGIFSNLKYINTLSKLIKIIQPDKIMSFQAKANTFGVIASKRAGYKDITAMVEGLGSVYGGSGIKNKIIKIITNFLYKIAFYKIPTVIFLNEDNKRRLIKLKLVKENQSFLINGIGIDINNYKSEFQPNLNSLKFVMIARVEKDKGIIEYCEAAKKIIQSGVQNVEFYYFGACDMSNNPLDDYKNYVNYGGYTDDIKLALCNYHVVVLPSYHEGVPRSLIEACAMAKPIIASNISGCKVCVIDNLNGKLVAIKSTEDLYDKLLWFINNKDQIPIMGVESRKLAEEKFDSNKINEQIYMRLNI